MKFTHSNILEKMTNSFTIATLTAFLIPLSVPPVATPPPPVELPVVKFEKTWKCPGCTPNEKYVLEIFSRVILSLHTTKGLCNYEETKQLFLNNVLSEELDNGIPAYYNSNILGRYMRKDYGNFGRHSEDNS